MPQTTAGQFESMPMSPNLSQSLGRAQDFAREQSHRALLLEHLLLALTEDPDAAAVLRACNVDVVRLGTDVSGYLGRLLEDMRAEPGTEPRSDPELLRVLEAAGQAAQQSRRRQIDGSIVLAAVVGDGKSPAAGLLKAHGMTFDEAIRALQKASAQARSKQFASSPAQASSERPATAESEKQNENPAPVAEREDTAGDAAPPALGQSVEEILAAARARIQHRAAAVTNKPPPAAKAAVKPPPRVEPETLPLMTLSSFTAAAAPPLPELPPLIDGGPEQPTNSSVAFPNNVASAPLPPTTRLPPTSPGELTPPLQQSPQSNEGPPRPPPPPQRPGTDAAAAPRLPSRPARAQRSGPAEPSLPRRPIAGNGVIAGSRRPSGETARPSAKPGSPARSGQRTAAGPLVETIPRRMRVGASAPAQVRIGRDKIDALMQLLMGGRAQHRPDAVVGRALTVRLRAPDGGFWIEASSPETQWVEMTPGHQHDEHVSWRWTVTPQRRGRRRLQLLVAARTIGRDGIAAETAPPDRMIEVAVRGNLFRRAARLIAFLGVVAMGAALGRFGQDLWDAGPALLHNAVGLLNSLGFLGG